MKKFLAILLAMLMVATVAISCADNEGTNNENVGESENESESLGGSEEETSGEETESGSSSANVGEMSPTEIIDAIYNDVKLEFMLGTMDIDLTDSYAVSAYLGLDSADKISAAAVSEPMTGSQAYSLVIAKVKDAADAQSVAEAMKAGIDPAKWICVQADDISVAGYEDTIMFVMIHSDFGISSSEFVDAFKAACGGTLSFEL